MGWSSRRWVVFATKLGVRAAPEDLLVDDIGLGQLLRTARIRRGWRQVDLAARAGVGHSTVSRLEQGRVGSGRLDDIRKVAALLEIRIDVVARWRGGDGSRLLSGRHAALAEAFTRRLIALGWTVRPEVSFSIYGERGVVDVLAWHPRTGALLVVEIKTEIVDVGEMLGTLDRKRRLARRIAADLSWPVKMVAAWVLVGDNRTNRRRAADHATLLRAALPADGRTLRSWVRSPHEASDGLAFMPFRTVVGNRSGSTGLRRVRRGTATGTRSGRSVDGPVGATTAAAPRT